MALAQEFFDIFIKIKDIERLYSGGFNAYCEEFADLIGETIWHDEYLLREGAMSRAEVEQIIDGWAARGLQPFRLENGEPVEWIECCVSSRYGGPTLPCSWLAYDDATGGAYLAGHDPGELIGPSCR
jgi:hypothetical protein